MGLDAVSMNSSILGSRHRWSIWARWSARDRVLCSLSSQGSILIALEQSDFRDDIFAVSCIQAHHQLRYEMRMLSGIAHSRQERARGLAFARARRSVAIGRRMVSIALGGVLVQIAPDFFLQQAQVQVFQGIGAQAGRVVGLVLGHQRDALQVARYVLEAERVEAIRTQSLEQ
jgi:hypothetical protein